RDIGWRGNLFQESFVVIVRRIDPPRNLPDGQRLAWEWDQKIARVRLESEPSLVAGGLRMAGIRSWMRLTRSFDGVVNTTKVRTHSRVAGSCQFSHKAAIPKGERSFMAIAYGCFPCLVARHS